MWMIAAFWQTKLVGLVCGLTATWRCTAFIIMTFHDDTIINIILGIIIFIIIITIVFSIF